MRLRDAAISLDDYKLWQEHEIQSLDDPSGVAWSGGDGLLDTALCLVADNAQAGQINDMRLAVGSPFLNQPSSGGSSEHVVVRLEARRNNVKGEARRAEDFRNMRKATHLRVGARVILPLNAIWDVQTVPLGLMNGARGVVVAILYPAKGAERIDGSVMAASGWPSSGGRALPRGVDQCPLPDFVVVYFPSYSGPALFENLPRKWVPVPCCEVRSQSSKSLVRFGCPLRLAWALTFHKSQGITALEGTIISFKGARMRSAVSRPGLAFVGWTRATTWAKVAFQSLPPFEDFLAIRLQQDFKARTFFESTADELHDSLLRRRGITEEMQIQGHHEHLKAVVLEKRETSCH